jgi:hypothetical protein
LCRTVFGSPGLKDCVCVCFFFLGVHFICGNN